MTILYVLNTEEATALENLMNQIGTATLPYLPSSYHWIEYALEDAQACDFRKKAAKLTGRFQHIRFTPNIDDLRAEFCSCGYEQEIGDGTCTACFTGMREEFEEEPMTYTCRYCEKEDVEVFKECPCIKMETFWDELEAPTKEVYPFELVLEDGFGNPTRFFQSEAEATEFICIQRNGYGDGTSFELHHLGGLEYAFDEPESNILVHGRETDAGIQWHFTLAELKESSIPVASLRDTLLHLLKRLDERYDEIEAERYEDYETEGPFGGAFRDQEDYENWRFGGIAYLNSI